MFREIVESAKNTFADCPLGRDTMEKKPGLDYNRPLGEFLPKQPRERTGPLGEDSEPLVKTDDNGRIYTNEDGDLLPNLEVVIDGNIYKTDENGRVIEVVSIPRPTPTNTRDTDAQARAGGDDRQPGDQGGHIVGRDMGGDSGDVNLIAMDARINQSDYKRMENDIKKAEAEGKDVSVKTEITYNGDSERPDKIVTTVTVDGRDTVYTFDNNIDGSLMEKLEETCNDTDIENVQDTLERTDGEISSIKEEFDEDGNLTKTTVTITYQDESGNSKRLPVIVNHQGGA